MSLVKVNSVVRRLYVASMFITRMFYRTIYMSLVLLFVFLMFGVSPDTTLYQFVQVTHHQGFWIIAGSMAAMFEMLDFVIQFVSTRGQRNREAEFAEFKKNRSFFQLNRSQGEH